MPVRETTACFVGAQSHGAKGGFNRIRGANVANSNRGPGAQRTEL